MPVLSNFKVRVTVCPVPKCLHRTVQGQSIAEVPKVINVRRERGKPRIRRQVLAEQPELVSRQQTTQIGTRERRNSCEPERDENSYRKQSKNDKLEPVLERLYVKKAKKFDIQVISSYVEVRNLNILGPSGRG